MQFWQEIAAKKQKQRDDFIPSEWKIQPVPKEKKNVTEVIKDSGILNDKEFEIIENYDATALAEAIAQKKLTALQVTIAYCKAAAISQQVANVLTEIFFDKAIKRAKELDAYQEHTGKVMGPFHGVPVSVKDYINIKDVDTTGGYIGYSSLVSGRKHSENAPMIEALLKAGAVLYVKTQNPQTLMCLDGDNNVYGPTYNPWNRDLTSGGSSSGEGGLISLKGSPIGIGSDIGGSVRGPAGYCGIYGFKPSCERLSCSGTEHSFHGQDNIKATMGPMGRSVRDMELFMKTMIGDEPWLHDDPNIWPLAWNPVELGGKKITIGIMKNDGVVHPHPPIARALEYAEKALRAAGHEVIEYEPYKHREAWELIYPMYFPDGAHGCFEAMALSGEPICNNPAKFIGTSKKIIPQSITRYMDMVYEKDVLQVETLKHFNSTKEKTASGKPIDVILSPVSAGISFPHGHIPWWGYTSYWNLQDYPGFTFPTELKADKSIDKVFSDFESFGEEDTSNNDIYDPEIYDGMPICLQVVSRRRMDEFCCAATGVIEKALKEYKDQSKQ